jgi:hypothetical protein
MSRPLLALLTFSLATPLFAQPPKAPEPKLQIGDPAPKLEVSKWLNGKEVKEFEKGKIYLLRVYDSGYSEFEGLSVLSKLAEKHAKAGVVVISVHSPRIGFGRELTEKERAEDVDANEKTARELSHPFAWDVERKMYHAYQVPTKAPNGNVYLGFVIDKEGKLAYIGDHDDTIYAVRKMIEGTWRGQPDIDTIREGLDKLQTFRRDFFKKHPNFDSWEEKDVKAVRETELPTVEKLLKDYPSLAQDRSGKEMRLMMQLLVQDYDAVADYLLERSKASGTRRDGSVLDQVFHLFLDGPIARWKLTPKLSKFAARMTASLEPGFDVKKAASEDLGFGPTKPGGADGTGVGLLIAINRKYGNEKEADALTKKLLDAAPEKDREKRKKQLDEFLADVQKMIERK